LPKLRATVVIPTLAADDALWACLESLRCQSVGDFEIVVVDNSGKHLVRSDAADQVVYNEANLGYGAAVNQGIRATHSPFIAALNDDTVAEPRWLEALLHAIEQRPEIGMCASQVRLAGKDLLDSAGMLMCGDGTSKQRGHSSSPLLFARLEEVLLPSASAALYRREMLDEIGLFDESFFLYCEDTDLGLRARWAGWECLYVPDAIVEHRYSYSAGKASELKAYYVERNRLYTIAKNFPMSSIAAVPFYACRRYFWHALLAMRGHGAAAAFGKTGGILALPWLVLKAHWETMQRLPDLLRARRNIKRRITSRQFNRLLRHYSISPKQVAAL
jgi:GT2 family glycosyltransferase